MNENLILNVFVVPNGSWTLKNNPIDFVKRDVKYTNKCFGIDVNDDDEMIQVWIHPLDKELAEQNDNWTDHGIDEDYVKFFNDDDPEVATKITGKYHLHAPFVLPYHFLKDKKEGDVVELTTKAGNKFQLTFNQLGFRYERFGKFDQVVDQQHNRYIGIGSEL